MRSSFLTNLVKRQSVKTTRQRRRDLLDLSGKVFGRLTVIELMPISYSGSYSAFWKCLCSCGKVTIARADRLKNGQKQSCGCLNNERRSSRMKQMEIARKYFLGPKKVLPEMTKQQKQYYKKLRWTLRLTQEEALRLL